MAIDERAFRLDLPILVGRLYPGIEEIPLAWDGISLNPRDKLFNWRHPTLPEPTRAQLEAEYLAWQAETSARAGTDNALRSAIVTLARGAEGKPLNALTQAEVRALLAVLLWKAGAVNDDATLKPLEDWITP